jgi:tetratricopeptide (TPR) repeat protein
VALAAGGDYQQFREALALLGRDRRGGDASDEDQRTRVAVLLTHPAHRREAIEALEKLSKLLPLQGPEYALLAGLHEAAGDWPRARAAFQNALAAGGDDPLVLAGYVGGLLRHNEAAEAKAPLARLQELRPGAYETVSLRARLLAMRGQGAEVTRLVTDFIRPTEGMPPDERTGRVRAGALLLDELGQEFKQLRELTPAAEELYRKYVAAAEAKLPESVLELAGYLGRQGQVDQALDLCRRARRRCAPEAVAGSTVAVLRAGEPRKADCAEVGRWLVGEIEKNPRSAALLQMRAELFENQGRAEQAEAAYRRVLRVDPGHLLALNNLAYLLALRGGDAAEALGLINRALRVAGPRAELLDTRAVVYLALGRLGQARNDLAEAIGQQPGTATLPFHLAQAYRALGDRAEAAKALKQARALGLEAAALHPLERGRLRRLLDEFR